MKLPGKNLAILRAVRHATLSMVLNTVEEYEDFDDMGRPFADELRGKKKA
jgi:hypothetical protein